VNCALFHQLASRYLDGALARNRTGMAANRRILSLLFAALSARIRA